VVTTITLELKKKVWGVFICKLSAYVDIKKNRS
jgi:hypothetical protein